MRYLKESKNFANHQTEGERERTDYINTTSTSQREVYHERSPFTTLQYYTSSDERDPLKGNNVNGLNKCKRIHLYGQLLVFYRGIAGEYQRSATDALLSN